MTTPANLIASTQPTAIARNVIGVADELADCDASFELSLKMALQNDPNAAPVEDEPMLTSPASPKGLGRAKTKNGVPPTAPPETVLQSAATLSFPTATPIAFAVPVGTEPPAGPAASASQPISKLEGRTSSTPEGREVPLGDPTKIAPSDADPFIIRGSPRPLQTSEGSATIANMATIAAMPTMGAVTNAIPTEKLSPEMIRRMSTADEQPAPVVRASQPTTNRLQSAEGPSTTILGASSAKSAPQSELSLEPRNLAPRVTAHRAAPIEAPPSALEPAPLLASRLQMNAAPGEIIPTATNAAPPVALEAALPAPPLQTATNAAIPVSLEAAPPVRTVLPREFPQRFAMRLDPSERAADAPESRTGSADAFIQPGQIPGVAGSLRLERARPDERESAGAFTAELTNASPIAAGAGTSIGRHPETISVAPPLTSPQWATAFGSAVVQMTANEISEATLTLNPDDLGTISVKIGIEGSFVSVGFNAENKDVRDAVTASMPMLQEMLARSGLSLGQSSVGREPASGGGGSKPQDGGSRAASAAPGPVLRSELPAPIRRISDDSLVDTFA